MISPGTSALLGGRYGTEVVASLDSDGGTRTESDVYRAAKKTIKAVKTVLMGKPYGAARGGQQ